MYTMHAPSAARRAIAVGGSTELLSLLRRWLAARRQRIALSRLDARLLADIGVSAPAARVEAARPFWDVAGR